MCEKFSDKTFKLLSYVAQCASFSAGPSSRQAMGLDANFSQQLVASFNRVSLKHSHST